MHVLCAVMGSTEPQFLAFFNVGSIENCNHPLCLNGNNVCIKYRRSTMKIKSVLSFSIHTKFDCTYIITENCCPAMLQKCSLESLLSGSC